MIMIEYVFNTLWVFIEVIGDVSIGRTLQSSMNCRCIKSQSKSRQCQKKVSPNWYFYSLELIRIVSPT